MNDYQRLEQIHHLIQEAMKSPGTCSDDLKEALSLVKDVRYSQPEAPWNKPRWGHRFPVPHEG